MSLRDGIPFEAFHPTLRAAPPGFAFGYAEVFEALARG
jgi:hypothetical protein